MPKRLALLCALLSLAARPAFVADKPVELQNIFNATTPYGSGQYSAYFMTVYDADLWTDAPQWSWDIPFALSLRYYMDAKGADLADKSVAEMNNVEPLTPEQTQAYTAQLRTIFPDVTDGDEITAYYNASKTLLFYRNGVAIGTVTDSIFAQRFLSIWLSPHTSVLRLRRHLLALSDHPLSDRPSGETP